MDRRRFLAVTGAGLLGGCGRLGAARPKLPKERPNFLFILIDDLGWADLGCYGSTFHETPNIDRLAAQGMRFTDAYAACPVCSPTRASILTGKYPATVNLTDFIPGHPRPWARLRVPKFNLQLPLEEATIAEALKSGGYATACVGKWHLGYQKKFLPTRQGFDYYYGIPYSNDMGTRQGPGRPPLPLLRNEEVIEYPVDQTTLTERYTEEAIRFITANKGRPFFLYLPHTMPHYPLHISKRFKGKSKGGLFGDVIECIDWGVGQILATIKKLGIDERTLVIYTSDNGPAAGSAGPLRGKKGSTWEGGMREPCIMRWPGRIPAGTVCSELATIMDLLPTIARLAGTKPPSDRVIDGKDIWPLLSGQPGAKSPYQAFFYHTARGQLAAVRSGKWKFHIVAPPQRRRRGQPAQRPLKPPLLYDLSSDIGETKNVAAEHPDVVERLTALLKDFDAELRAHSRPVGRA